MKRTFAVVAVLLGVLAVAPWSASAQERLPDPKVTPIQVTGPASQRLNLIILGDGYQKDQQSLFYKDLDRNLSVMWATEPFRTYRNYINVYAVEIASIDYGVRCDPDGRVRHPDGTIRDTGVREGPINGKRTALRMFFDHASGSGCTSPLARGVIYGGAPVGCANDTAYYPPGVNPCETGSQAHNRILETYVAPVLGIPRTSQNIQTLAIFNSFTYGGIGGTQATTSGGSPQGPLVSLHEIGHSLGTMADEYLYFERDVVRPCSTAGEPTGNSGFHLTNMTSAAQMIAASHKWFRWLGEESLAGGKIGLWEGGNYFPCGVRRPSQHSIMQMLGFDWDQVGREHMVARITGMRNSGQMNVQNTATAGTVAKDAVLWVESGHPRFHALNVTWRRDSATGPVLATGTSNLDLEALNLPAGTVVSAEVRDPVGPDGIDWVRNPSTNNSAPDSGFNGSRFVQRRTWTVGDTTATVSPAAATITAHSANTQPVAADEVVFVETNHPADRVLPVTWTLNGAAVPNPANSRTLDLGKLTVPAGTSTLVATVTDGALSDAVEWKVDKVAPTAARQLSAPLTTSSTDTTLEHPIYFGGWDMRLDPKDDTTGYTGTPAVVGQLRLDNDGWFNYFGFPEQEDAPFQFRPSGQVIKALTYGNLGTGGLSTAGFLQTLPDDHPNGRHIPGFGTHLVEHRAIDPAGNYGKTDSYRATVLPGAELTCGTTVTGTQTTVNVTSGVTCLTSATVSGAVNVAAGASVLVKNSTAGSLSATGAKAVQVFGSTITGLTRVENTTEDVTLAGNKFNGGLTLNGNTQLTANARYSRLAGAYGPVVAGNTIKGATTCLSNSADVRDFGAPNTLGNAYMGCALASSVAADSTPGGTVPATLSLTLGAPAAFGAFTPGLAKEYTATTTGTIISTAGDATLSYSDPGHMTNGAFSLAEPLRIELAKSAWTGPTSNESVGITFKQLVKANDPLRTGTYSRTVTFTLSTTQP
jgi:hypothetical protein